MGFRVFPAAEGAEFSYRRDIDIYFIDVNRLNATLADVTLAVGSPFRPFIDAVWISMCRIEV